MNPVELFNYDECLERNCDSPSTTMGYCRQHYIRDWVSIKEKLKVLKEGVLQSYIEEFARKFTPEQIQEISNDLSSDKDFFKVLKDLKFDGFEDYDEFSGEDTDTDDDQEILYKAKEVSLKKLFDDD